MKKMLLVLAVLSMYGCQEDDNVAPVSQTTSISYDTAYMFLYPNGYPYDGSRVMVNFVSDRIVKRIGGMRPVDGGGYVFGHEYYDDITYSGNRILLEEGKIMNYSAEPYNTTAFIVGNQNRITHKIKISSDGFQLPSDTIKYQYGTDGLLMGTTRKINSFHREAAVYYYNANRNLDSIVWREIYQDQVQKTVIEKFSDYDQAPNPLRKLFIFEETFLRSLSTNNFMKYERITINNTNPDETFYDQRSWTIPHDANGNIMF